jgi:kanamycin kinase
MNRTPITVNPEQFPESVRHLLAGAQVYDSSCSPEARVYFVDKEEGFYLKTASKGSLQKEATLTAFYHKKGLAAQVLAYEQRETDWLLTRAVPGEDCLYRQYIDDPERICDTTAELLRRLHDTDFTGCPVLDRTGDYIATVTENYRLGKWDESLFPDNWGYRSAEEAWAVVQEFSSALKSDTLLHGDYCLPNIMLNNWNFSGFIDLGNGGVGDRHIDLFWGTWSLFFNLKTDTYRERFLDVYGRDRFDPEILGAIGAFEVFG